MALDKLEAMRAFCRIVETGSFKNAADTLNIPTTTLSGQIQSLENQLGLKLLHRTTRKVSPTADGLHYYQRILPLLNEIDEINQEISQQETLRGVLKIELPSPVADYLIVPNLPDFLRQYPHLRLEIGSSERVVDLVAEGVDCAIRGGIIADESLVAKVIGQMPFCLCATADYLSANVPISRPEDLEKHCYLGFKFATTGKLAKITLASEIKDITPTGNIFNKAPDQIYNNAQTYYQAVLSGLGIGYVPKAFAKPYLQTGELIEILPDFPLQAMPMSLVYPYSRYIPKRVKAFQQWVNELIRQNEIWQNP